MVSSIWKQEVNSQSSLSLDPKSLYDIHKTIQQNLPEAKMVLYLHKLAEQLRSLKDMQGQ